MQSFQNGRVDNNGVWFDQGDLVWVSVMTTVVSYIPGTTTISQVINWIVSMISSHQHKEFTAGYATLYGSSTTAIGYKLDSAYELYMCSDYNGSVDIGHFYTVQANLCFNYPTQTAVQTTGDFRLSFDMVDYCNNYAISHIGPVDFNLNYQATPN
jgi:hypothetical protein